MGAKRPKSLKIKDAKRPEFQICIYIWHFYCLHSLLGSNKHQKSLTGIRPKIVFLGPYNTDQIGGDSETL